MDPTLLKRVYSNEPPNWRSSSRQLGLRHLTVNVCCRPYLKLRMGRVRGQPVFWSAGPAPTRPPKILPAQPPKILPARPGNSILKVIRFHIMGYRIPDQDHGHLILKILKNRQWRHDVKNEKSSYFINSNFCWDEILILQYIIWTMARLFGLLNVFEKLWFLKKQIEILVKNGEKRILAKNGENIGRHFWVF